MKVLFSVSLQRAALIFSLLLIAPPCAAQLPPGEFDGGTWIGTFEQTAPVRWKGPVVLFLRYDASGEFPWAVSGFMLWKTLGSALTQIQGQRSRNRLEFSEVACTGDSCPVLQLWNSYSGSFNSDYDELHGTARLKAKDLLGRFHLRRIVFPDQKGHTDAK